MKRVGPVLLGCLLLSLVVNAGHFLTNDTGVDATGLRVVFSESVSINSFGDTFTQVSPTGTAREFIFSGGVVAPWGGVWFNQTPTAATIERSEWLTGSEMETASSATSLVDSTRPLTYEEIMAKIAKYPGPDEPLYQPKEGEQIWLTDLEGHADIYDNDSIKINYAPGFDKSQITRIDVYRNGVKMRFLPALFDVLTNAQMKTFDGNPAENTPASSHTDHAIMGYEYTVKFHEATNRLQATRTTTIRSPVSVRGARSLWLYIVPPDWGPNVQRAWGEHDMRARLAEIRGLGFTGVQISVVWFVDGQRANQIMAQYESNPEIHPFLTTADDDAVRCMLRLVEEASLDCYLRLEIIATQRSSRSGNYWRGNIEPTDLDLFFESYGDVASHYAQIAEEEHVEVFCPLVEMESLEQYTDRVTALLDRIDVQFNGELAIDSSINHYLSQWASQSAASYDSFLQNVGKFYDWVDDHGRPLRIDMSCWNPPLETQRDQRFSVMVESFVRFWSVAAGYFRAKHPGSRLSFGEIGTYNYDGMGMLLDLAPYPSKPGLVRDDQEFADIWAAYLYGFQALELDELAVWAFDTYWEIACNFAGSGILCPKAPPMTTIIGSAL